MTTLDDRLSAVLDLVATLPGPTTVHGDDELADRIRLALPRQPISDGAPATVFETTGTAAGITAALEAVDDHGTVVSAAVDPQPTIDVDLYADFHVRGITLRSVGPPRRGRAGDAGGRATGPR